jgi:hydroxymethylbilane synthase
MKIRIATRESKLALYQANMVADILKKHYPQCSINLVKRKTLGDKILDKNLNEIGGKALFMKELEQAILDGDADIAAHSLKDVPYELPVGFNLAAFCEREQPNDAFVSNQYQKLDSLQNNAIVGTSSLRRGAQILAKYPEKNIQIRPCRGNVQTRLQKLDSGQYDAIILAYAGLKRLGLDQRIQDKISTLDMLPAAGQGIVVIETLTGNAELNEMLSVLNNSESEICAQAERTVTESLKGSCQVPIAAFAEYKNGIISLSALVSTADGSQVINSYHQGENPIDVGRMVADELFAKGANDILDKYR